MASVLKYLVLFQSFFILSVLARDLTEADKKAFRDYGIINEDILPRMPDGVLEVEYKNTINVQPGDLLRFFDVRRKPTAFKWDCNPNKTYAIIVFDPTSVFDIEDSEEETIGTIYGGVEDIKGCDFVNAHRYMRYLRLSSIAKKPEAQRYNFVICSHVAGAFHKSDFVTPLTYIWTFKKFLDKCEPNTTLQANFLRGKYD